MPVDISVPLNELKAPASNVWEKLHRFRALYRKNELAGNRPVPVMSSGAPTVTWNNTSDGASIGLGAQWSYSAGKCSLYGGIPTLSSPGYYVHSRWFSNANGAVTSPGYWQASAIIFDSVCGILVFGSVSNGCRIIVDGQLVSDVQTTAGVSGYNILKLDFSSAGGRKAREIAVEFWGGGTQFVRFLTSSTGTAFPTKKDPLKLMVVGDSVSDGSSATWNGDGYPRFLGQHLGIADTRVSADAGTGFITVGGTGKQNFQTRVADVIANSPDILITALSSNDYSQTNVALVAAVNSYIDAIRLEFPSMPIILFGSLWNDANLAVAQSQESAVEVAVISRNDPLLAFVKTKTAGSPTWPISGQGSISSPSGSGTSDFAFVTAANHPSTEGMMLIARFMAESIRGVVDQWLQ